MNSEQQKLMVSLLTGALLIIIGAFFISYIPFGYTEAAILYLAGVVGAGCFWIGLHRG